MFIIWNVLRTRLIELYSKLLLDSLFVYIKHLNRVNDIILV